MYRLAAFAAEATRRTLLNVCHAADFEFLAGGDRLARCLRNIPVYGVFIVGPDVPARDVPGIGVVRAFRRMPIIFCGKLSPELAAFVAVMGREANPCLFIEHSDDVRTVTQFVNEHSPAREQLQFGAAIADAMARLPIRVQLALATGLRELPAPAAVGNLASRVGVTERAVLEIMHSAGFTNSHSVFAARRLIDVWGFAQDPGYRPVDLARKGGYTQTESLLYLLRGIGVKSITALASISPLEIVPRVVSRVLRC